MLLSRKIAYGGSATSLILLFTGAAFLLPTADFAFFSMTSLCIAAVVILCGMKTGLSTYFAAGAGILALFGPLYAIPFALLFGIYPILKGIIELKVKPFVSFFLKLAFFAFLMVLGYVLFQKYLLSSDVFRSATDWLNVTDEILMRISIPVGILILFLYDYALSLMILMLSRRVLPYIKK